MPMNFTEIREKTLQANAMLEHHKANIPENTYHKLMQEMQTNPQAVINTCDQLLDNQREIDIAKFTSYAPSR